MKEELKLFLKDKLGLELSMEKTKVTHITDGFKFLGFWMERSMSGKGKMVPKITIPKDAIEKFREKITVSLTNRNDSLKSKILALNAIIRGWCQYYQHTSSPQQVFGMLSNEIWWNMAHWIGRKYQVSIPVVCRRHYRENSLGTKTILLLMPSTFKTKRYKRKTPVNPYTAKAETLSRETLTDGDMTWIGNEHRKGWQDMREIVLELNEHICTLCGTMLNEFEIESDHIKPRSAFKRPSAADTVHNLQIVCTACHRAKTKSEHQVLSRVR